MIFKKVFGEIPGDVKICERQAVRAVIFKDNKLLMVKTNKGDYKFPGGGKEKGETDRDTIIREVQEETGYQIAYVNQIIGTVLQQSQDMYEQDSCFVMTSLYYECALSDKAKTEIHLEQYEKELEFSAEFVTVEHALENNEQILKTVKMDRNPWVERETYVLREIHNCLLGK